MSYGKKIPIDLSGTADINVPPAVTALQQFIYAGTASSVITFNDNATNLEVSSADAALAAGGVLIKWIASSDTQASVTGTNFDHFVPVGQLRRFVIPQEKAAIGSIVGANIKEGLYRRVAWIPHGTTSVIATTY